LSGFVSSGFSVGAGNKYKGAFAMAIIGGTASEIGGGKFSNGAMGSAFQYMFNDLMDQYANKVAFGDRDTDWHKENDEILKNTLAAGAVILAMPESIALGIAKGVEAVGSYMFTHPMETMTGIEIANDVFNESMPPSTPQGAGINIIIKGYDYVNP
jgi:hypothetical protein